MTPRGQPVAVSVQKLAPVAAASRCAHYQRYRHLATWRLTSAASARPPAWHVTLRDGSAIRRQTPQHPRAGDQSSLKRKIREYNSLCSLSRSPEFAVPA
jgi:hypothetical protein